MPLSAKSRDEFRSYLHNCTDAQVQGVYDKERAAGRDDYAIMAEDEAYRRNIPLEKK